MAAMNCTAAQESGIFEAVMAYARDNGVVLPHEDKSDDSDDSCSTPILFSTPISTLQSKIENRHPGMIWYFFQNAPNVFR